LIYEPAQGSGLQALGVPYSARHLLLQNGYESVPILGTHTQVGGENLPEFDSNRSYVGCRSRRL